MTISPVTYPYTYVAGTTDPSATTGTTDPSATDSTTTSTTTGTSTGTAGTTDTSSTVTTELQALLSSAQQTALSDMSVLLGTSSDDLFGSLSTGSTLTDLMSQSSIDPSLMASVISNGLLLDTTL